MSNRGPSRASRWAVAAVSCALAAGGVLAAAGSASATAIPVGQPGDSAYSGFGPAASLFALANGAPPTMAQAAQMLDAAGDPAMTNGGNPWTADDVSFSNIPQIVSDFTGTDFDDTPPTAGSYLTSLKSSDSTYSSDAVQMINLGSLTIASEILSIAPTLETSGANPGGLYSVNGDMIAGARTTVTSPSKPAAYTMTLGTAGVAAATATAGYVMPQAESFTYPKSIGLNLNVIKDEIPYADLASPPSTAKPIGTVTLNSPLAAFVGGSNDEVTGDVYLVHNENPNSNLPDMELYVDGGVLTVVGHVTSVTPEIKVTFDMPNVESLGQLALPLSDLTVAFPAATSPFTVSSCTTIASPTAKITDYIGPFARDFGDDNDGDVNGVANPISIPSSKTVVTNDCQAPVKLSVTKASVSGVAKRTPKFGFTLADTRAFSSFGVTVPKGFSFAKLSAKDIAVSGGTVKSVAAKGQKLTVSLTAASNKVAVKLSGGVAETTGARKDASVELKLSASGKTVSQVLKP
jgi:hypothetical protein